MAGNIGVELYLAVGKMKPVSPNFNHLLYKLNPYSANIKSANTVRGKILEWEKIGELWSLRQYFTRQLFLFRIFQLATV